MSYSVTNSNFMKFTVSIFTLLLMSFAFASIVSAHGYVSNPESRAVLCEDGVNLNCGGVVYEPQSIEGPGNFPEQGVADGEIASGGGVFPELDEQSADRWAQVPMSSGAFTFEWTLTAAHATENWSYYITKEGWDPNSPLERSDFELFCNFDENGKRPDFTVNHDCEIPQREGYHVILAYWEVADTANAFYQVIDANFDGDFVEPGQPGDGNGDGNGNGDGDSGNASAWDAGEVYLNGDQVSYNGATYEAKWWTRGETPDNSNVWTLVEGDTGNPDQPNVSEWSNDTVYNGGDQANYNGILYEAKWWTQGQKPSESNVWFAVN